jgi:hypothetical protein
VNAEGEVLETLLVQEPTAAGELVVRDLSSELEQSFAAEAVRVEDLLGCAAHSSGVYRREASGGFKRLRLAADPNVESDEQNGR